MTTVLAPSPRPVVRPVPRPAPARPSEPRRHLRVVRPHERTARRLTPAGGVVLTLLLFAVLAGLAGAHSLIAQGQIRLDRLDEQLRQEQTRYQELRRDVAIAESPERIVAAAEAQGMVTPSDLVYLQPSDTGTPAGDRDRDARDDAEAEVTVEDATTSGSWSTVKPLLEAPAP